MTINNIEPAQYVYDSNFLDNFQFGKKHIEKITDSLPSVQLNNWNGKNNVKLNSYPMVFVFLFVLSFVLTSKPILAKSLWDLLKYNKNRDFRSWGLESKDYLIENFLDYGAVSYFVYGPIVIFVNSLLISWANGEFTPSNKTAVNSFIALISKYNLPAITYPAVLPVFNELSRIVQPANLNPVNSTEKAWAMDMAVYFTNIIIQNLQREKGLSQVAKVALNMSNLNGSV